MSRTLALTKWLLTAEQWVSVVVLRSVNATLDRGLGGVEV